MFKNRIAPKKIEREEKTPQFFWSFSAPCYDNRNMIHAGTNYGTGFNQPVGSKGGAKQTDTVPKKSERYFLNDKEAY